MSILSPFSKQWWNKPTIIKSQGIGNTATYQYTPTTNNQISNNTAYKKTAYYMNYQVEAPIINSPNSTNSSGRASIPYTDVISIIPTQKSTQTPKVSATSSAGGMNQLILLGGLAVLGVALIKGVVK